MKKAIFTAIFLFQMIQGITVSAQQHRFHYYPEVNMYYDVRDKKFIYNDNGTWVRGVAVPAGIPRLGRRVTVRSESRDIWYQNHIHREQYLSGDYDPIWNRPEITLTVPMGYLPAVGSCRLWYPEKKLDEQPTMDGDCEALRVSAPTGAWVVSRPNNNKVVVEKYSYRTQGLVREIRHYRVD